MAKTLQDLLAWLESLTERAPLQQLTKEIGELEIGSELDKHTKFSAGHYARNLVHSGPWYNVWVMCWKNGQRSPIHNHASSTCGVRVLRGILTETKFEFAPNGHIKAISSRDLSVGQVCGARDDNMHQISNLQAGNADLVTLH